MFCDLVEATSLSERLDLEDFRTVIRSYQQVCDAVIDGLGGYVAQYLGDGLLVYFGFPVAHEEDAVRAVRAGLGMIDAVQNLSPSALGSERLRVRIGVHTGSVLVGEIGDATRHERLALGGVPNVAARLQSFATPNTLVVSADTYRIIAGYFDCEDLGPRTLKGISVPIRVYRVVEQSEIRTRFELAVRTGLTPLVGREEELRFLSNRWERAKAGQGQVVTLSGEAGIGKSRLLQVLGERLAGEAQIAIGSRCSPYFENSALHPVIESLLAMLLSPGGDASPRDKLERLEQVLSQYRFAQPDTVPLIASLLSLPYPPGYAPLTLTPERQRQRTLDTLVTWLLEETERQPVHMIVEDLHWADPSTLEFLNLLIQRMPVARLLLLLTFRPHFLLSWGARSHVSHLSLDRLQRAQVEKMVGDLTRRKALPPEVMGEIAAKTDGVPLFVEELTKMVIESEWLEDQGDHYGLRGPLPPLAIPTTLQDSLMARLDQLGPHREVAQLGACLGREFPYDLIRAVSPMNEAVLQKGLQLLVGAELLYQRGTPPRAQYAFKHAMIRDAAYESLLKSRRQEFHREIGKTLEGEGFSETAETQPELVAHHFTAAGLADLAIPYWQKAGQRAGERAAHAEAVKHYKTALDLLRLSPEGPSRDRSELGLQVMLALSLASTLGYAAAEVEQTYNRAHELCRQMGEITDLFPVLRGLSTFYMVRNDQLRARSLAEECVRIAGQTKKVEHLIEADTALGYTMCYLGEFEPSQAVLERGVARYETHNGRTLSYATPQDPGVACLMLLADVLWWIGYPDQALRRQQEALHLARELAQPFNLAFVHTHSSLFHQMRRESQRAEEHAREAIRIASEHGFDLWVCAARLNLGIARAALRDAPQAIALLRQELVPWEAAGAESTRTYFLAGLAGAHHIAGELDEARAVLSEALRLAARPEAEHMYDVLLYWLSGELHRSQTPAAIQEAESDFRRAIEVARLQRARSLELRAALSLCKLLRKRGDTEAARSLLEPLYGWFTEGLDTVDLRDARALLAKLK